MQIILQSKHEELQVQAEKLSTAEVLLGQASDQQVTAFVTSGIKTPNQQCPVVAEEITTAST